MKRQTLSIAKLTMPTTDSAVPRPRLFALLDQGRNKGPVIWVHGPAGSGKTMLVASYLAAGKLRPLWYRLDRHDADPSTFFYYLGLAGKAAAPRKRGHLPLLTPEYLPALPVFARRFFEELFLRLGSAPVIVFDDFHEPAGGPFFAALQQCISAAPEGASIVIISRKPPASDLARHRAAGALTEIGWGDLRLTKEETSLMLERRGKAALDAPDIHARTDGWAAGVVLLADAGPAGDDGDRAMFRETFFPYFLQEVLAGADAPLRELLVRTAFFPDFTEEMAERAAGADARLALRSLRSRHFFIEYQPGSPPKYRYHPLFREFLLQYAEDRLDKQERLMACLDAARELAKDGQRESAAELFRDAAAWDELKSLIIEEAAALISQGRQGLIETWTGFLPADQVRRDAWLLYWRGSSRFATAPAAAHSDFAESFERFRTAGDVAGATSAWCGVIDSSFYAWHRLEDVRGWIARIRETRQNGESALPPGVELQFVFCMTLALAYLAPDDPEYPAWLARAETLVNACPDPAAAAALKFKLARLYLHSGEFDKLAVLAASYERGAIKVAPSSFLDILWNWVVIYGTWQMGHDIEPARIDRLIDRANESGIVIWNFHLYTLGFMVNINAGAVEEASRHLGHMAREKRDGHLFESGIYEVFAGRYAYEQGNFQAALRHAEQTLRCAEQQGVPIMTGYTLFVLVSLYWQCGLHRRAEEALRALEKIAEETDYKTIRYRCFIARAYLAAEQGRRAEAERSIADAFALGKQYRFLRIDHWHCGDVMSTLCAIALEKGIETPYAKALVAAWNLQPNEDCRALENWPWPIKLYVLGRFEVLVADEPVDTGKRSQQKRLDVLRALASFGPEGVAAGRLADLLWPDAEGDKALHALDMALLRLRRLCGREDAVEVRGGMIRLNISLCWVDAQAFGETVDAGINAWKDGRTADAARLLERALPLYKGHLSDNDGRDGWAVPGRERLRMKYLLGVETLCGIHENDGEQEKALDLCRRGIEIDELSEELCRRYMQCCLQLGRRSEALSAFRRLERALRDAMGVAPSGETVRLLQC